MMPAMREALAVYWITIAHTSVNMIMVVMMIRVVRVVARVT